VPKILWLAFSTSKFSYLDGLERSTEQHIVTTHKSTHRIFVSIYGKDFLEGINTPYLHQAKCYVYRNFTFM